MTAESISLGLRENWRQFTLLVVVNAFVGAMIGLERTVIPLLAESDFGLLSKSAVLSFLISFGIVKAISNLFAGRLGDHGITIELTDAARVWLAEQGYDPAFGARPLRRTLQKQVESPLSVRLLKGEFKDNDTIVVDFNEQDGLVFITKSELVVEVPDTVSVDEK